VSHARLALGFTVRFGLGLGLGIGLGVGLGAGLIIEFVLVRDGLIIAGTESGLQLWLGLALRAIIFYSF